ncbi:hypothetical protein HU200_063347 [Digitaria exilis]|uniref:DUF6598 domain-containing protein n=1 Tax=Digitaria exilis TaxID=1010633 RepID=A0A835A3R5_9POAL|nr:hypothetical protein HU200_063347 [Digitaria exilis]
MEVPWETEAAGDQERSSRRRRRRRQGKASASRSHSCDESKMQIGKEKRAEQVKNPSPPSPEKGEEEEEGQLLDDETAEDFMRSFRDGWESCFGGLYGSFEDNTSVPSMRYTEGTIPRYASCEDVLQIFSVQVIETKDGLEWPLHVYGWIATRDSVDQNRNLLFNCTRDNCQILTQEDSYLLLTGPSRAVVFIDPVAFEVQLKVKGKTESEDNMLCLDIFEYSTVYSFVRGPFIIQQRCYSKRCTLMVRFAPLVNTVEATVVKVQVIDSSWAEHVRGKVLARTFSIDIGDIMLLDSRDGRMPITCAGEIKLARNVCFCGIRWTAESPCGGLTS